MQKLQKLVKALNEAKGAKFVSFTYTNKQGEKANRLIQLNTIRENALKKDLNIIPNVEYVENDKFDKTTFITAQLELIKSTKMKLGIGDSSISKVDKEKYANRSNGQKDAYVQVAKNMKFNLENQQLHIYAKEVRKTILVEGVYPTVNSRPKTIAKRFIEKQMKSSKYRTYILSNFDKIKINGDTIELG
jgi:hypothetical protein